MVCQWIFWKFFYRKILKKRKSINRLHQYFLKGVWKYFKRCLSIFGTTCFKFRLSDTHVTCYRHQKQKSQKFKDIAVYIPLAVRYDQSRTCVKGKIKGQLTRRIWGRSHPYLDYTILPMRVKLMKSNLNLNLNFNSIILGRLY